MLSLCGREVTYTHETTMVLTPMGMLQSLSFTVKWNSNEARIISWLCGWGPTVVAWAWLPAEERFEVLELDKVPIGTPARKESPRDGEG